MTRNNLAALVVVLVAFASAAASFLLRAAGLSSTFSPGVTNLGGIVAVLAAIWVAYERRSLGGKEEGGRTPRGVSLLAVAAVLSSLPLVYSLTVGPSVSLGDILPITILLAAAIAS